MTISKSSSTSAGRQYAAKNLTLTTTPCLNGQWKASYADASGKYVGKATYALASEMLGRLFPGGIHTVEELEEAEKIAGQRPDAIAPVDGRELAWAKPELLAELVATGKSRCSKLADPGQLDELRAVVADLDAASSDDEAVVTAWKARASRLSFIVLPYGCTIPDDMLDVEMIEFDISRRERRAAATTAATA